MENEICKKKTAAPDTSVGADNAVNRLIHYYNRK